MSSRVPPLFLALVCIFACGLSAFSTTSEFNTSVATVTQLVHVDADLSYPQLVPGAQYAKNVTVRWALPPESLNGLTADHVIVHVLVYAEQPSWMVFYGTDGSAYRALAFDLNCHVQNGTCAFDSHLNQTVVSLLRVPTDGTANHSERLWVQASLLDGYQSVPSDNNTPDFSKTVQNVLQNLPVQPVVQFFQQFTRPNTPNSIPSSNSSRPLSNDSSIAIPVHASSADPSQQNNTSNFEATSTSESATGQNSQMAIAVQTAQQPSPSATGPASSETFGPIAGFSIAKSDAVFFGGLVVFGLLAFLFFRHFFGGKKGNGVFDA